jgi:hypothetical protein
VQVAPLRFSSWSRRRYPLQIFDTMGTKSPQYDLEMRSRSASKVSDRAGEKVAENGGAPKVVIVSNLSRNIVEIHLRHVFSNYGDIRKVDLPLHHKCPYHSPYAFIQSMLTLSNSCGYTLFRIFPTSQLVKTGGKPQSNFFKMTLLYWQSPI